jgi:ABC-type uncharacterized transport system permease subunit
MFGDHMLSNLMSAAGALLVGLGGVYVGRHIEGELSFYAFIAFAIGIVWLSQAPVIALRKRVRELELKLSRDASVDNT